MAKHKCKIPDPPMDTTRWMGTYGDMVTLLMAFFVMLFAVSETNNEKFVAFVSGLAGPFDNSAFELGLVDGATIPEANVSPINLIAPAPGYEEVLARADAVDRLIEDSAAAEQLAVVRSELEGLLEGTGLPISADLRDDERGLVVSISTDDVLFPVGSAELADVGRELIAQIAPALAALSNTIVIEGHTDDQPLNTEGYSNWNLSTDRAVAVLELLGVEHGISWDRVSAAGYGEYRPLTSNDTAAGRAINRRVEILIVGLETGDGGDGETPPTPAHPNAPPAAANPDAPAAPAAPAAQEAPPAQVVTAEDDPQPGSDDVADLPEPQEDGAIILPASDPSANGATLATILGQ